MGLEWELVKREKELLWLKPSKVDAELTKEQRSEHNRAANCKDKQPNYFRKILVGKKAKGRRSVISR